MKHLKISKGGQVSVPASVRHRWNTRAVAFEDRGDHAVLRPAPEDPAELLYGAFAREFADAGLTSDSARRQAREEEHAAEEHELRRGA